MKIFSLGFDEAWAVTTILAVVDEALVPSGRHQISSPEATPSFRNTIRVSDVPLKVTLVRLDGVEGSPIATTNARFVPALTVKPASVLDVVNCELGVPKGAAAKAILLGLMLLPVA